MRLEAGLNYFTRPTKSSDGGDGAPEWALTYGDMMSLLLVFFIAMAAYSTMDVVKYRSLVGSIQTAFGARDRTPDEAQLSSSATEGIASAGEENERREVEANIEDQFGHGTSSFEVVRTAEGMRIRLEVKTLFEIGRADLKPEAWNVLAQLAPYFKQYPYRIWVEGHTDNVPIGTELFPSNWELSAARAGTVVRTLIERGAVPPEKLVAAGYADTRPVGTNGSEEGRAHNRRVEFLLSRKLAQAPVLENTLDRPSPLIAP